jgi:dihydroorotase
MKTLLKNATIIDAESQFHSQKKDVLIANGIIEKIDTTIEVPLDTTIVSLENLHISCGWFDTSVCFGEPGFEERETIKNGLQVAAKSGFTAVAVNPNTHPVIDSKSDVEFLINKAAKSATKLVPIGALTKNCEGKDLAELFDMQQSGAIAFGDYAKPISNDNLMKIALLYAQNFDGLVLSFPKNNSIAAEGIANEGINSTQLGMKGIPALAEHLQISRDLFLRSYIFFFAFLGLLSGFYRSFFRIFFNNDLTFKVTPQATKKQRYEYLNFKNYYIGKKITVFFRERTNDGLPFHANGVIRDYE